MPIDKVEILNASGFGSGTAELDELLRKTFVETVVWNEVFAGRVHTVHGPKGSGKSAIYALLKERTRDLRNRHILLIPAENPTGNPVFENLPLEDETDTEEAFRRLWELYFLTLIADTLREQRLARDESAQQVIRWLETLDVLPINPQHTLRDILGAALAYVATSLRNVKEVDAATLAPIPLRVRIVFRDSRPAEEQQGTLSIGTLYSRLGRALSRQKMTVWLAMDRLDVAFVANPEREGRALRALFRAAATLRNTDYRTSVKIFLRSDIWERITQERLPEASAIEQADLVWSPPALMDLITRRLISNQQLCHAYHVEASKVLKNFDLRDRLFHQVFPATMPSAKGSIRTFQWLLEQLQDGLGNIAPRDVIGFLISARQLQLERHQYGTADDLGPQLFDAATLVVAAARVSTARLEKTLYAEYPEQRHYVERLRGRESEFSLTELGRLWDESEVDAKVRAEHLAGIGLFSHGAEGTYRVPPLYQYALRLDDFGATQGSS